MNKFKVGDKVKINDLFGHDEQFINETLIPNNYILTIRELLDQSFFKCEENPYWTIGLEECELCYHTNLKNDIDKLLSE